MSALFTGMLDDAAVFPPGALPLAEAVAAHPRHRRSSYGDLVGSLVLAAGDLPELAALVAEVEPTSLPLSVTAPLDAVAEARAAAERIPAVRLVGLEVSVPDDVLADDVVPALDRALSAGPDLRVHVEIPRDERRSDLIRSLSGTAYGAKLRTGGVRADLHPDERELAAAIRGLVDAGVPFKATAGLHHAIRRTDPVTGFEQHGFLNLLAAAAAATDGASVPQLAVLLGERDPHRVRAAVDALDHRVRDTFASFGTCSISEPTEELGALGLLAPALLEDLR